MADVTVDPMEDKKVLDAALDWVITEHTDGKTCPVCHSEFLDKKGLAGHMRGKYPLRVAAWYLRKDLGSDAISDLLDFRNSEPDTEIEYKEAGVQMGEDYNEPNMLHVPEKIMKKVQTNGAYERWVSRENIQRRYDSGFRFAERDRDDEIGKYQIDTSDTKVRAGDLVLMVQPRELREKRNNNQDAKTQTQQGEILTRGEERENNLSDVGRATYNAFRDHGANSQVAMQMANNADKQGAPIRPRGANAIQHRR